MQNMQRIAQIGIAVGTLGAMLMLMSLFPGVIGRPPTPGVGPAQLFVFLTGFGWMLVGALFYVKFAFYAEIKSNLAQQIGTRLVFTGLVLAVLAGFPDNLGFGSHGASVGEDEFFGFLQRTGILASYFLSCIGVLVYAVAGPEAEENEDENTAAPTETGDDDASESAPEAISITAEPEQPDTRIKNGSSVSVE